MSNTPPPPSHYYPPQPGPHFAAQQNSGSNGLATAGFVVALVGLLGSWIPIVNIVAAIMGVLGLVLAAIGLAKSKKAGTGKGLAIAGIILGALAVIVAIAINAAFVDAVDEATDSKVEAPPGSQGEGDADLGTSRDNPAPLGSTVTGGDWTVTINSVSTTDSDAWGDKPDAGQTLLVINLTATYNGTDEQGSTPWATVKYVSADGTTVDSLDEFYIAENEFDSLSTVFNGASVTGDQLLAVPADSWNTGVLAVSPSFTSDDTFIALQ